MATVSFQQPTDYAAQQAQIDRQRKYAELLQQQGLEGTGQTDMVGGWAIPKSHWEGIGKLAQSLSGAYQQTNADDKQKALGDELRKQTGDDFRKFTDLRDGHPEASAIPAPDDSLGGGPGRPYQAPAAGDRNAALAFALDAKSPYMQQMAGSLIAKDDETYTLGEGQKRLRGTTTVATNPKAPEYGPVSYETVNGQLQAVQYAKDGSGKKVLGPASPQNQFNAPTVDATQALREKQRQFDNLSQADKIKFQLEGQKLGISAAEAYFTTGERVPTGVALPPSAPPAPMPAPGAPAMPQQMPQPAPQMRPPMQPPMRPGPQVRPPMPALVPPALPPGMTPATNQAVIKEDATKRNDFSRSAQQTLPTLENAAQNIDQKINSMLGTAGMQLGPGQKAVAPAAGFSDYVGGTLKPGARFIPGTDAANFQARHNEILGQTFMQAYQSLKGGGAITEVEGDKAQEALNRMSKSQSETEYVKAARDFQAAIHRGVTIARRQAQGGQQAAPAVRVVDW